MKRLREYDTVTVNVPFNVLAARTVDVFDARVLAMVGPTAALEPVTPPESLRLPPRAPHTLLSFRHGNALVGLKGVLTLSRESSELRFRIADGVQLNRRSATRIKLALPVRVGRLDGSDGRPGQSVDLSADGILVETALRARVGERVRVSVVLAAISPPLEATARVVRSGGGLVAMQFDHGAREARSRLGRLVVEHNREALRLRRAELELVEF